MNGPRILLYDIETWPAKVYTWGAYDQNIIKVDEREGILCVAWKWLGEDDIHFYRAPRKPYDQKVVRKLHQLFDEADIIVAHNGDRFDERKANAAFINLGLTPPSPYFTVDTKKASSRFTMQYKNNLDYLGDIWQYGRKKAHEGFDLWEACMAGDEDAWRRMEEYNVQDIVLLERVYLRLRPWIKNHPNLGLWSQGQHVCPNCQSKDVIKRGVRPRTRVSWAQQWQCKNCGKYSFSRLREKPVDGGVGNV